MRSHSAQPPKKSRHNILRLALAMLVFLLLIDFSRAPPDEDDEGEDEEGEEAAGEGVFLIFWDNFWSKNIIALKKLFAYFYTNLKKNNIFLFFIK